MTYVIELTPDRLTVTADLATAADIAALVHAIAAVTPLLAKAGEAISAGANRPEEITRESRQAKALRAERADKENRPERQDAAIPKRDEAAKQIDAATVLEDAARLASAMEAEEVAPAMARPAGTLGDQGRPDRSAAPPADQGDQRVVVRRVTSASVPEDRDEKLRKLWATELTLNQIADKLGLHSTTVSQRAKHLGLPSRKGRQKRAAPVDDPDFDPAYYARRAIIPDEAAAPSGASITAAILGDPSHGASVGVERAGMQRDGGGAV